ncbi:glycosyltransferase family 4 protein [Millisia brevis]|uniref:glycosyltransferase family 4 protein n=1 Tax=Millisia brevis TaxID=264148 RepID=UPI00082C3727|nr:glycosyltransferase family 1 protein [Millisia brevis]
MRALIDCRYVRPEQHDGISRFTAELVTELARLHPIEMLISDERQLHQLPDLPWHRISAPTSWREPFVARQVRALAPDVVFSPMQTMGGWGRTYPLVLTLHDLIYYRHRTPPADLPEPVRLLWRAAHLSWWPQRLLLNRADHVVTVSQTTADLIRRNRLTRRDVTVVYNAPSPALVAHADIPGPRGPVPAEAPSGPAIPAMPVSVPGDAAIPAARPDGPGVLVYMGSFMPYKNVDTLVRAARLLPDHELHLMSRITAAEEARLREIAGGKLGGGEVGGGARLVFHNGATDAVYRELLGRATALVTASRDEGFGIPLVEAMALGAPVVVSDIPVFREIGGEAAYFVNPDDAEGFAAAIERLSDRDEWTRRSAAARRQSETFTWSRSAAVLSDLLVRLADRGRR